MPGLIDNLVVYRPTRIGVLVVGLFTLVHLPVGQQVGRLRIDNHQILDIGDLVRRECPRPDPRLGQIAVQRPVALVNRGTPEAKSDLSAGRTVDGRKVHRLALVLHLGDELSVQVNTQRTPAPNAGHMIPLPGGTRRCGRRRLVVALADLEDIVVDLHVAETQADFAFETHDRRNVRIVVLEVLHIDPAFERNLRKSRQVALVVEPRHDVFVAGPDVDALAPSRSPQHKIKRARRCENRHTAIGMHNPKRQTIELSRIERLIHGNLYIIRDIGSGLDCRLILREVIQRLVKQYRRASGRDVVGFEQFGANLDGHAGIPVHNLRSGDRKPGFLSGRRDRYDLCLFPLGLRDVDRRLVFSSFLTSCKDQNRCQCGPYSFHFHSFCFLGN